MSRNKTVKPWGGRFTQPTDSLVESFTASVDFDQRLYRHDIAGSIAHARMLAHVEVLSSEEYESIVEGLQAILIEIEANEFDWEISLEDVHMNIEARLISLIGDVGKKLHTGRSRNDQVATDMRLYLRDELHSILEQLILLQESLVTLAETEVNTIMPGFTHLQVAQPISFAHHLLAWFEMFKRDYERLVECRARVNVMPLGAAALAGTSYPIDREYTAELLGFSLIAENSLDAVSDRDFIAEFLADAAIMMMHLSRISEEIILWMSPQFAFIDIGDSFCTGSSIMPQKKNPDVPELVRGKTGRVFGNLVSLLTIMKGQPLAYNRDNQEDKEPLFDTVDTLKLCLRVYTDMVPAIKVNAERMYESAQSGYSTATDLADYLVRKGLPFRDAHEIVGKTVHFCMDQNKQLPALTLAELKKFSAVISEDVYAVLTLEGSIASRDHRGGTAPNRVKLALQAAREWLKVRP